MRTQFRRPAIWLVFLLAIAGFYFAGCGGGTKTVTVTQPTTSTALQFPPPTHLRGAALARACPPGQSFAGCSVQPTVSTQPRPGALINAPKFPDVSIWQGSVGWGAVADWQRAHGWPTGGIFKMGEIVADPRAWQNSAATKGLDWRQGYWFVRDTGCVHEAAQIIFYAHLYSLRVVQLDLEVPEARGYGLCLSPLIKKAGLVVGEYTSPGANPGGVDTSDPLWVATFGSSFTSIWHPVVAWQCTDGHFGCVTDIPGIGKDDVSYDFGISTLGGSPPPPPDPLAFFDKTVRHFGKESASEYNTVRANDRLQCHHGKGGACVSTRRHLRLLAGRDWTVAHRHHPPAWDRFRLGKRFQGLWKRYLH